MSIILPDNKVSVLKQVIHLQGISPELFIPLVQGYQLSNPELLELLEAIYKTYLTQCQFNQVLAEELYQHRLIAGKSDE